MCPWVVETGLNGYKKANGMSLWEYLQASPFRALPCQQTAGVCSLHSCVLRLGAAARALFACAKDSPEAAGKGTPIKSSWCLTQRGTQANQEEERNFSRAMVSQDFIFCAPCSQYVCQEVA
jgi:hypothetical protein